MSHISTEIPTSPADRHLADLLRQADDFFKIELLRPARSYYEKALLFDPASKKIQHQISECDRLLAFERKVIWILLAVTAVLVGAFLLAKNL
jgi:hypothetical protein